MQENNFFKFVWRFNGLALMAVATFALGLGLFTTFKVVIKMLKEDTPTHILNIQKEQNTSKVLTLGSLNTIKGSACVMVSLSSGKKDNSKIISSYGYAEIKNYLFINNKTNTQYWLFKNNKFQIQSVNFVPKEKDIQAIVYHIIKKDSNGDGKLSQDDLKTVAISLPDGTGYKVVCDGIDTYIGQELIDKNTLIIMYQKKRVGFFTKINLNTLAVFNEVQLSKTAE